jgi:hypothetical protein
MDVLSQGAAMQIGEREVRIVRALSGGVLAAVLLGCSGSGATAGLLGEDGGDGSSLASDAATGGDAIGSDGAVGPDGSAVPDGATGADAASDGGQDAITPDGQGDAIATDGGSEEVTPDGPNGESEPDAPGTSTEASSEASAADGSIDSTVSDGSTDGPGSTDGANDATVADASTDVTGIDVASNDAPGEAQAADATTGDASTADATSNDAAAPDAAAADAGGDVASDSAADAAPDAMGCSNADEAGGPSCHSLCNTAPVLPVLYSTDPLPVPTGGGAPPPGLYYVTAITYYFQPDAGVDAGLSGGTFQETAVLSNAGFVYLGESVVSQDGVSQGAISFQLVGNGTDVLFTQTCPTVEQQTTPYSRSGGTFTVYIPNAYGSGGYVAAATLTLQTPFDGGAPEAGLPDAGNCSDPDAEAGSSCTSICNTASPIGPVAVAADAPAATGGPVADGTYYLTARHIYMGADGGTDAGVLGPEQETIVVATTSDGIRIVQYVQSGGSQPASVSTIVSSGNTLYFTSFCPQTAQTKKIYSANGNTMMVYDNDGPGGAIEESVYTLQ